MTEEFVFLPWQITEDYNDEHEKQLLIIDKSACVIARLDVWRDDARSEMETNANIIATAPESLNTNINILNHLVKFKNTIVMNDQIVPEWVNDCIEELETIITKARGDNNG